MVRDVKVAQFWQLARLESNHESLSAFLIEPVVREVEARDSALLIDAKNGQQRLERPIARGTFVRLYAQLGEQCVGADKATDESRRHHSKSLDREDSGLEAFVMDLGPFEVLNR